MDIEEYKKPRFEDADYDDAFRVDPLTAMDQVKKELSDIDSNQKARQEAQVEKERASKEAEKVAEPGNEASNTGDLSDG